MKKKIFRYLVDGVTKDKLATLRKAVAQVPQVTGFSYNAMASTLIVEAPTNPVESVELACRVAGVSYRAQIKD